MIAPTGTIGLVMDCDTTGVEPDFALVKFKKLAGGGYFKIINRCVPEALADAGLRPEADRRHRRLCGRATARWRACRRAQLRRAAQPRASATRRSARSRRRWNRAFDIRFVFNKWTLGEEFCTTTLGFDAAAMDDADFDMLKALGFAKADVEAANLYVCGAMTLEGAPHLKAEHLPVFDCANPCGRIGKRSLSRGKPHPHDGGGAALHLGRHLQDHQHAERGHGEGMRRELSAVLEAGPQGQRALSRRLQAVAAAGQPDLRLRRRRGRAGRNAGGARRGAHRRGQPNASSRRSSSASSPRAREACRSAARATPRRPSSAATRSICAPANTRTARSAKSSSTCTRKAPPSAR